MSKILKLILVFSIVAALGCSHQVFFSTTSPSGIYKVELSGNRKRSWLPARVTADVTKDGKPFWNNIHLHSSEDAFDLSFEIGYPDHRWVHQNLVQFYDKDDFQIGIQQPIIVYNRTNRTVRSLYIHCGDKFLLFDLQPNSETSLLASPDKGGRPWLVVEGEFYDGETIKGKSLFDERPIGRIPNFRVSIIDERVEIETFYSE